MQSSMEVPQKIKNRALYDPYDPTIPFLSIYPKEIKIGHWRDICPVLIAALFTIGKK